MILQKKYNEIWKDPDSFFTFGHFNYEEARMIMDFIPEHDWAGLSVLEIGCGWGELAAMMAMAGANVLAIDYSIEAIMKAREQFNLPGLRYETFEWPDAKGRFDVIVMQGVLEHFDEPWLELRNMIGSKLAHRDSACVITTSPSFLNPRGYVWMTLQLLFDVPMSLTDKHFFFRNQFMQFAEQNRLDLAMRECDYDWGNHEKMLIDFRKRLPKALADVKMKGNTDKLMMWLAKASEHIDPEPRGTGATMGYKLSRKVK